ncbi:aminopeptidase N [Nocardioides sp. MJB4]|uniref:Aminopeptidase N n=1 Tax=Nocardioides donggukensis TaxID=2774019 RepID=A0A927K4H3_9ACTN|nr:aminopeptidase N [Nocardioides donggukensis]
MSRSLQLTEARDRAGLLRVSSYDVALDLAADEATFGSVTTIRFESRRAAETFVDLKPARIVSIHLDGQPLDPETLDRGRLPLRLSEGGHELVVDAVMGFRQDGEGLHAHVDPADGRRYVYGMSFMDAAPSIFACFDQPDLKAPYTFHVRAPEDWTVIGNAPGSRVETVRSARAALWEFERTQPLSTYFVTLVAGPYHVLRDDHDGIPLGLSARRSLARDLDADADELFTLTKQCFDEYHRLFGIRYPFGDYHQAFVPEFNAGAMENPGCVTFRDPLVFSSRVTRGERIKRATTVAHEMAHQWFGNITTPRWWDDLWLNESFAEYLGNRVTADVTQYGDAWIHHAYARRQWGLVADQRPSTHPVAGNGAVDAGAALQDFDGISYVKGSSVLKQLNAALGDEVFFAGVVEHLTLARFGNAEMADLFGCWERAGAVDLSRFTEGWLRTPGADHLTVDRDAGVVRRSSPAEHPADREHSLRMAVADPAGAWRTAPLAVTGPETPVALGPDDAIVLDPDEDTWALTTPDPISLARFPDLLRDTEDTSLRAAVWNTVRSGVHNALVDPEDVVALAEAALPTERNDDAVGATVPWLVGRLVPVLRDPVAGLGRLHAAASALLGAAAEGSTLQLAAYQSLVSTTVDPATLRAWSTGTDLPAGLTLDLDLRWRVLVRLAGLGEIGWADLDRALEEEPTARAHVEHARAVASLPEPAAKAWAWDRFTGAVPVANYELAASGHGLWRPHQEQVTAPYVERYFAELPQVPRVHAGWVLGTVTQAFFPVTSHEPGTVARADELIARDGLDPTVRRNLVDATDDLRRQVAVKERYGG